MALGGRGHWDASLGSLPRLPNHNTCEMGELTQTGNQSQAASESAYSLELVLILNK